MFKNVLDSLFGTYSDRALKKVRPIADQVEALEPQFQTLTDEELRQKTQEFKERYANGETLDQLLPEAFANCREAFVRTLKKRPFYVQILGGIVLHQGRISEMKTGEGKTFVAVLPAYLNAISGKGVHIVTVNDYLAKFQSEQMGLVLNFLGMSVGCILHGLTNEQRRRAYACDVTYGTNNEFGFDYLRDNMVMELSEKVQRPLNFAIVDEVDSILIDEARTPLIISGVGDKSSDLYVKADQLARRMTHFVIQEVESRTFTDEVNQDVDYIVNEKQKSVTLTPKGTQKAEQYFGVESLSDPENITLLHHVNQAIRAHGSMRRDREYVVRDGQVIIVDEFTGRLMYGRRFNEGLHQAIEAKEGVKIEKESRTLATITFQNYFRLYSKLSGMTGTALTEEDEFDQIYSMDVIAIPTNRPMIRRDENDAIYKNEKAKLRAVVEDVAETYKTGQPILVGTISVEKSEELSAMLRRRGIPHNVLNAKFHDKEAEIVAQAGRFGAVTIATNMAGRGTDILLGGNPEFLSKQQLRQEGFGEQAVAEANAYGKTEDAEVLAARARYAELYQENEKITEQEKARVVEAGGLYIIGTERHESRRIDNQLRGRSGRQGDPGKSRFYISLEDDLMRLFGGDRTYALVDRLGLPEDMPIEAGMLSNAIESAQKRVEGRNFDIRKSVLQYDDVMNQQRTIIYEQRDKILGGADIHLQYTKIMSALVDQMVATFCNESSHSSDWDWVALENYMCDIFFEKDELDKIVFDRDNITREQFRKTMHEAVADKYASREQEFGFEVIRQIERLVMLRHVNDRWMAHIDAMADLKNGIGLRAVGQKDPVQEYKFEGFNMFDDMNRAIREDSVKVMMRGRMVVPQKQSPQRRMDIRTIKEDAESSLRKDMNQFEKAGTAMAKSAPVRQPTVNDEKVGRNDPCPCGSGKKYKNCCGKNG